MKRKIIAYNPKLKNEAKRLRKNSTPAETLIWQHLKGRQRYGFDFHRQKPLDQYIVDFFCNELMLAIEIDGCSQNGKSEEDMLRQERLESLGISILRFLDRDAKENICGVVEMIDKWIEEHTPSSPDGESTPLKRGMRKK